ncbi:MAG: hypothetical protein PVH37_29055 [Desulfobacterales bacterium]|jgi:hypothetical protein
MMTKVTPLAVLPLLLLACAHGKTNNFPTVANTADAAHVYIIRDNNFVGWGFSLRVMLNESIIARLRSGEYVSFYVEPGFHSVGISEPTLTVPFAKGRTYYFLIGADYTQFGFNIQRISNRKGELWLSKTKPVG